MSGERRPEIGVGAVVVHDGRLLVIRRARPPAAGAWSVPGGHVEWGETLEAALVREVHEETGLTVRCGPPVLWAERIHADHHVVILDFRAELVGDARPRAGDDAAEVRWVDRRELDELPVVEGLIGLLDDHGVLDELR